MKKIAAVILLGALLMFNACAVIKYSEDGEEIKGKKKIFYVVNGLAPITPNNLKSGVEYKVTHDIIDIIITGFTSGIIYSRTVEKIEK